MSPYLVDLPIQIILLCVTAAVFLGTLLLAARPRWLVRSLWIGALALSTVTVVSTVRDYTAPPSNYCHYYLGAKYRMDYLTFYEAILAARGQPLHGYRDLAAVEGFGIKRMTRDELRRHYRGLLNAADVDYELRATVDELRQLCGDHQLLERDGRRWLAEAGYDAQRIDQLVHDAGVAGVNVRDCGFNGSPFYILVRQLDPAVHAPLSLTWFRISVLLELVFLAGAAWLLARTFGLGAVGALLFYLLALGSWDYYNWNLAGLPAMLWFVPSALVMHLYSRDRLAWAGVACAVATLLKIFPGLVGLPVLVALAVGLIRRRRLDSLWPELGFVLAAGVTAVGLVLLSQLQADWFAWAEKIRRQFVAGSFFAPNDICFFKSWRHSELAGGETLATTVVWAARVAVVGVLGFSIWRRPTGRTLALGALAALSMMPWISREFLQYYTFSYAAVMVILFVERRLLFFLLMPLLLVNQALLDFPHPLYIADYDRLVWVKTAPYLVIPLAFLVHLVLTTRQREA